MNLEECFNYISIKFENLYRRTTENNQSLCDSPEKQARKPLPSGMGRKCRPQIID